MRDKNYFSKPHKEGFLKVFDYDIYFRDFGDGEEVLILLHGGPGNTQEIFAPLTELANEDLRVFLYDQYATGKSDGPEEGDFTRFTVEHFRDELDEVISQIDAESLHLYGHSWGGILALEYALEHQEKLDSLIISNTTSSMEDHRKKVREKVKELPQEKLEKMVEYEEKGNVFADEYRDILMDLYNKHSIRMDEIPKWLNYSLENENSTLYGLMWGPNEFYIPETSKLYDWSVKDRLEEIKIPTLVMAGKHDHFDPSLAEDIKDRIHASELAVFEESGHIPFWDQTKEYNNRIEKFLKELS